MSEKIKRQRPFIEGSEISALSCLEISIPVNHHEHLAARWVRFVPWISFRDSKLVEIAHPMLLVADFDFAPFGRTRIGASLSPDRLAQIADFGPDYALGDMQRWAQISFGRGR